MNNNQPQINEFKTRQLPEYPFIYSPLFDFWHHINILTMLEAYFLEQLIGLNGSI